jgi:nitrous oxidase accessory protein NosD
MTIRRVAVSAVLAVCACIAFTAGIARAAGPVCTVSNTGPADYTTIQAAVSDPGCTTINVAAGTYNEQVTIGRTLTLNGARAGVDARSRSGPESVITNACGPVQIEADNVVINGFTIQGSTLPDPCFLSGIWTNPGFSGTQGGPQILNNIVQNNISGIELDSTCTNPTLVQHNLIRNNNNPGPGSGNGIQTNFGLCNATIDANTFSGDTSSSILVVAASSNLQITGNQLVAGTPEGIALLNVSTSNITGNTSLGSTSGATIDLFGGNSNVTVSGNVLANGMRGLQVENPYAVYGVTPNSGISAHMNCISGNSVAGLEEDSGGYSPVTPGSLDATNNWWGRSTGPTIASNPGGTGDKIVDQDGVVAYSPFLTSPTAAPCPVPPPTPPRAMKQAVLDQVNAAIPGASKHDADKLKDVSKKLTDSLTPSNWIDGSHLVPKRGDHVFDDEKDAVHTLMDMQKDKNTQIPSATLQSWIDQLVSADQTLAQTEINDATTAGGDAKKLADAQKEMAKASDSLSKGKYDDAIDHYKNAWHKAEESVHNL